MSRFRLLGLALALGWSPAFAHETLPAGWCPVSTQPVIVGEFSFTSAQLAEYRTAHSGVIGSTAGCTPKTCGIVDEWFWAQEMSASYCGGVGLRSSTPEDAVAFVEGPTSFNHRYHHAQYRFDQGPLTGQCVVCRPLREWVQTRNGG
jgi:hypothetical protein